MRAPLLFLRLFFVSGRDMADAMRDKVVPRLSSDVTDGLGKFGKAQSLWFAGWLLLRDRF